MKTLLSTLLFLAVAQVAHADNTSLLGTWLNANSKSTGVTRLLIRQSGDKISVTTYGKCAPSDCA